MQAAMTFNGSTVLAGVAGWPISHSRSPLVHNYWFKLHGIKGAYIPMAVPPEKLREAIHGLQAAGFRGLNVTVPHKETTIAIADHLDESARRIGAANTLSFNDDGSITAINTDSAGFLQALKLGAPEWRAHNGPAVVLGAGGAARSVIAALLDEKVEIIHVINRSRERSQAQQAHFGQPLVLCSWGDAEACFRDAALLVNTTTLGMQGQPRLEVPLDSLPLNAVVNDLVYAPLETELLAEAHRRGMVAVDGLGMLLHQAAAAFEIWFGIRPVVDDALRRHVLEAS